MREPITRNEDAEGEPEYAVLTFQEQNDGHKVGWLPSGKVALVHSSQLEKVQDGEQWRVRLHHMETYAFADPLERLASPRPPAPAKPSAVGESEVDAPAGPGRVVHAEDRVALFVDGANMDYACRAAGYFLDYGKALAFFLANGTFYGAFFYTADFTDSDPLQQRFLDFLSRAGYIVRKKPVKQIVDGATGAKKFKCNLDTEIVLDMLNTAENYDVAFLFSGDSDFERAVDLLRARGKRVYIVSTATSLSRELTYVADKPVFLIEQYREQLYRDRDRQEA